MAVPSIWVQALSTDDTKTSLLPRSMHAMTLTYLHLCLPFHELPSFQTSQYPHALIQYLTTSLNPPFPSSETASSPPEHSGTLNPRTQSQPNPLLTLLSPPPFPSSSPCPPPLPHLFPIPVNTQGRENTHKTAHAWPPSFISTFSHSGVTHFLHSL